MELRHKEFDEALKVVLLTVQNPPQYLPTQPARTIMQVARQAAGQKKAAALKEDKARC